MATESLVRISGSVDRWQALNDPLAYRTSAVEMAIEGLDFSILKGEKSQSLEEETVKLSKNNLGDYEEEFEDDRSCDQRSTVPAQKSEFAGSRTGSLDSMQDKNPASSPATQIGADCSPLYEQLTGKNNGQAPPQDITTACPVQEASSRALHPAIIHAYTASQSPFYHNFPPAGFFGPGGYHTLLPPYLAEYPETFYGRVGVPLQLQPPLHVQYLQPPLRASHSPFGTYSHFNYQMGFYGPKKEPPCYGSHYYGSPTHDGAFRQFPEASVVRHAMRSKLEAKTRLSHSSGDVSRARNDERLSYFLEEVKSGNGQRLELSDIEGYVVEFSVDQHGSRFVQQKLATCSLEEKASIFKEISPHASKLITDVFGNYVVQKLFEHGSWEERRNLADQLTGQILPLSMQMYGCRVIQKALDVIDLEQKTRLVRELDGHVLRCVRDQNGNHVIQKCIDSIPIDDIRFVVSSFRGHVASLSMHPYGCRVIQRFLVHFNGNAQTKFIMDEILDSVCSLAQDRYGNYVTQHALERGNPHERSRIVEKLLGCIMQMSRHKFASNVVEKCVEYCDSDARGMLIEETLGDRDNLLVMMKDRYANYVVQTILEKCSTEHREVLLGRIRSHLTVLKKYTYGKHIVSRFEKLCGDG